MAQGTNIDKSDRRVEALREEFRTDAESVFAEHSSSLDRSVKSGNAPG